MSMSPGELKRVKVQAIRDIAAGLEARAASMTSIKDGLPHLPHVGTWTGVAADSADHEVGTFGKGLGSDAETEQASAKKVRTVADEFEGLQQLLSKLENDAAGKFAINDATGEVTPLSKDFNKSDRDYIATTLKQLGEAGARANDELAAAIHASDASGATSPAGAASGLPAMPGSAIKPDGSRGALQNLAAPNPDGDPGATKAAGAGTDTQANYKEWYPKNAVPVGDKNVDPSKLGGVGAIPGVRDVRDQIPQRMSPTLQAKDVPAFKDLTRQNLQRQGVPADQIEARVNDAVTRAQTPHFLPDAEQMRTPGEVPLHNSPGDQFNNFVGRANDAATNTVDSQIEQAKILTGQAGPGAPGVAEAWKEHALAAAKQIADPLAIPKMAIQDAQDLYNNPAEFVGKKMIEGPEALAALPLGGEGAAGARGLLGDLTHNLDDGLTTGHHAPPQLEHPTSTGSDHTPPSVGDHSIPPTGSHAPYVGLPHDAPTPPPLPSDHPLFDGYHDTPPGPKYTNPDGSLHYPDASDPAKPYAVQGTIVDNAQLAKGTVLGRFGYPGGEWLAPEGTPFAKLSLPPESALKPYYEYVVSDPTKLPPGYRLEQSQAAPWFNQPGMGPQYRIIAPRGQEASVDVLARYGFLARIGRQ